ncbi:bidirectional sugar transporter N3-like [Cicer arietinum]|uniref:Bidirectional sugar transporter SWEET n=1 Tax=Cicer arietinum TaxID=3827 RepID=A0A1S3EIS3_CICAR|nr:bidirectional sugar transporter N3-like [Cicer arietinum]
MMTYAFIFGILGNIISFLVYLAPLPTFIQIYKNKCTEGFDSLPYVVALFSSMLWLYYGFIQANASLLISINSFGCVVEAIYCIIYIIYAPREVRKLTIKLIAAMDVGSFILIWSIVEWAIPQHLRVQVLGWICMSISVSVFASPLSIAVKVIRTRSVQYMPFSLSFSLTLSAVMWFFYGYFKKDKCVFIPNIVGFILGVIQMVLYAYYKTYGVGKEEPPCEVINIVVMNPSGTCEVFPIPLDENDDIIDTVNQ